MKNNFFENINPYHDKTMNGKSTRNSTVKESREQVKARPVASAENHPGVQNPKAWPHVVEAGK
ncbi:hypothetical protein ABE38_06255 [Brevibacillus agri]|nr:hypothetical protein D478_17079 [Brevibacillus agri BAB-2500]MBG9565025.1 hypothetical protein [Brevibacillus agri]